MHVNASGIVIKSLDVRESDKYITIFTDQLGKIKASVQGVRRKSGKFKAETQLFAYSDFVFFENKGYYSLDSAELKEQFFEISSNIEYFAVASYFAEILDAVGDSDIICPDVLRIMLNALYALAKLHKPTALVKAAFELKIMAAVGYEPSVGECAVCGKTEPEKPQFCLQNGSLYCGGCRNAPGIGIHMPLSGGAISAMRYILSSDVRKIFSFELDERSLRFLGDITQAYAMTQFERSFKTLDFYNRLRSFEETVPNQNDKTGELHK